MLDFGREAIEMVEYRCSCSREAWLDEHQRVHASQYRICILARQSYRDHKRELWLWSQSIKR